MFLSLKFVFLDQFLSSNRNAAIARARQQTSSVLWWCILRAAPLYRGDGAPLSVSPELFSDAVVPSSLGGMRLYLVAKDRKLCARVMRGVITNLKEKITSVCRLKWLKPAVMQFTARCFGPMPNWWTPWVACWRIWVRGLNRVTVTPTSPLCGLLSLAEPLAYQQTLWQRTRLRELDRLRRPTKRLEWLASFADAGLRNLLLAHLSPSWTMWCPRATANWLLRWPRCKLATLHYSNKIGSTPQLLGRGIEFSLEWFKRQQFQEAHNYSNENWKTANAVFWQTAPYKQTGRQTNI